MQGHFLIFTQPMPNATDHNSPFRVQQQHQYNCNSDQLTQQTNKQSNNKWSWYSKKTWCFISPRRADVFLQNSLFYMFCFEPRLNCRWCDGCGWDEACAWVLLSITKITDKVWRPSPSEASCTKKPSGASSLYEAPCPDTTSPSNQISSLCLYNLAIIWPFSHCLLPHISWSSEPFIFCKRGLTDYHPPHPPLQSNHAFPNKRQYFSFIASAKHFSSGEWMLFAPRCFSILLSLRSAALKGRSSIFEVSSTLDVLAGQIPCSEYLVDSLLLLP